MYTSKFELPILCLMHAMSRHDAFKTTLHHCVSWCKVSYGNSSMQMFLGFLQCGIVAGCEYLVDQNYTTDQPTTHIQQVSITICPALEKLCVRPLLLLLQ